MARASERILWLQSDATGQQVRAPFTLDGRTVDRRGYYELCWILRDTRVPAAVGDVVFDVRTMEALWEVQRVLHLVGVDQPIVVHSGYRTPATNAAVEGAHYSFHLSARAVDFHVPGVSMEYAWAVSASRAVVGGIGYYPGSHVHIDSGPRRYWRG